MSEERLEIIKENVYMRSEIAKISRLGIDTSLGEELELLKEIERLNNIINELEKEIISQIEICKEGQVLEAKVRSPFDTYSGDIRAYKYLLYKLKELKEE